MNIEKSRPYHYRDTPDGEDIFKKLWAVLKPTAVVAFGLGTCDVILYSKPKGYLAALGRYAFVATPLLGVASAFVLTSNMVCNIRKKDDVFNWIAGGMMAGSILGAFRGKQSVGWASALMFGAACGGKKYADQVGYKLVSSTERQKMHTFFHDYSMIKDQQGAWRKKFEN